MENNYVSTNVIKSIIDIDDKLCTLLLIKNINQDLIQTLKISLNVNISDFQQVIKSNVAIASAITSIARIHMRPFKIHLSTKYTDSIFTSVP